MACEKIHRTGPRWSPTNRFAITNSACAVVDAMSLDLYLLACPLKRDTAAVGFNLKDFNLNNLAHLKAHTRWQLAAVQQAILLYADIHECAKIHHIPDGALQAHARSQVFHLQH